MEIDPNELAKIIATAVTTALAPKEKAKEPDAVLAAMTDEELKAAFVPASPFDGFDDDDLLYYATPYFDELQAKKAKLTVKEEQVKSDV